MSVRWCLFLLVVNVVALWPVPRGVVLGQSRLTRSRPGRCLTTMVNNSMSNTLLVARRRRVALCKKAIPVRAMWLRVNRIERA